MKNKLFGIVLFVILSVGLSAQSNQEVQQKYISYMDNKDYLSCFRYLEDVDPDNDRPDIFALKVNLILGYYITSMRHQMFSLKDLSPNEDLGKLRAENADAEFFYFPVPEVAEKLLKAGKDKGRVYHSLGLFYYDILAKYGNRVGDFGDPAKKSFENFKSAIDAGWENPEDLWEPMAKAALAAGMFEECALYFGKVLNLDRNNPVNQYQMGLALYFTKDYNGALPFALYASRNAETGTKLNADMLVADIYLGQKEFRKSQKAYLALYDEDNPNLFVIRKIILSSLYAGDRRKRNQFEDIFAEICSEEIQLFSSIYPFYISNGFEKEFLGWLERLKGTYTGNDAFMGTVSYYEAVYYLDEQNKGKALKAIQASMESFSSAFEANHPVFNNLNKMKQAALEIESSEE